MSKLDKNLMKWVSAGIINQTQANQISAYENNKPEKSWIFTGLLILGLITLGIGVISLIAANWQNISDFAKLIIAFSILSVICFRLLIIANKQSLQYEILMIAYLLFCLAAIGLISQIYQMSGTFDQALLFWALITFAAAYTSNTLFVPIMWLVGFLIGISVSFVFSPIYQPVFRHNEYAVFQFIPLFCLCLMLMTQKIKNHMKIVQAFASLGLISLMFAIIFVELHITNHQKHDFDIAYIPAYILAIITATILILSKQYNLTQKFLFCLGIALFLGICLLPAFNIQAHISYAVLDLLLLSSIAVLMANMNYRRVFQYILFLVGVRILLLYFQALGGLAMTGVGLIVAGIVLIVIVMLWNKYRTALALTISRWTHATK